jgi:ankyrin repeat protein
MNCESFMATKNSRFINSKGTDASKFLLHQACLLFPTNLPVVFSAVILDPSNLYNRVRISELSYSASKKNKSKSDPSSSLPLHIAIECRGSFEVLQHLALAAPEIIAWKDGPNDCNAISALLHQKRFDLDILSMFIRKNREALLVVDRLQNTSLHVACAQGAPLELVTMLYEGHPEALGQRNMSGHTPLQISQQNGLCSIEVNDFLHDLSLYPLECNAHHLLEPTNAKRQKVLEL